MTDLTTARRYPHDEVRPLEGPQLEGVRWLYHSGYYDGPLSGMVNHPDVGTVWADVAQQCMCWFDDDIDRDHDSPCGWWRRYTLIRLTPDVAAAEAERHADFRRHVGTHCDYDETGRRNVGALRPQSEWHTFYDRWRTHSVDMVGDVVGWFQR